MADLLMWWPVIAVVASVILGQVIQTKVINTKLSDTKELFKIELKNICDQVKKQNSRVSKLEDARINHIIEYHSER